MSDPHADPADPQAEPADAVWRDDEAPIRAVGGVARLSLLVRLADRPLQLWVEGDGKVQGLPFPLSYARDGGNGYVLKAGDQRAVVTIDRSSELVERGVRVEGRIVRRFWLPRWRGAQGDMVVPVLALAFSVIPLQLALLAMLIAAFAGGGGQGMEPSPEYLQRLLRGDYAGEEQGVLARREANRPKQADPLDSYYLQPGHGGPLTQMGGGKNLGDHIASGNPDPPPRHSQPVADAGAGELDPSSEVTPPQPDDGTVVDAAPDPEEAAKEDQPVAVHVTEGWGLNDWYDTEDARKDAKEIEDELELARRILKLDPDDAQGMNILAYYQYLAMDYAQAEKVYTRMTVLYPEDPAGWNNLALTFKRRQEYVTEEKYYRIALELSPLDDHAMNNLAVCLAHQGRFEEAIDLMKQLEVIIPGDSYADLHRAKIYAAWGKQDKAYTYLEKSLRSMRKLDTLHNIEFRQDIRLDPAFEEMRQQDRFRNLLMRYYGDEPDGWWKKLTR